MNKFLGISGLVTMLGLGCTNQQTSIKPNNIATSKPGIQQPKNELEPEKTMGLNLDKLAVGQLDTCLRKKEAREIILAQCESSEMQVTQCLHTHNQKIIDTHQDEPACVEAKKPGHDPDTEVQCLWRTVDIEHFGTIPAECEKQSNTYQACIKKAMREQGITCTANEIYKRLLFPQVSE